MAGRTIGGIQALLGDSAAIVRAMPNTPAAVRQGVTVACPAPASIRRSACLCERLLRAIGVVAWVDDEALLDPVTAVSGSGPAYVFLLAELMEQAAIEQGIPPDLARLLARQTVSGSGALLAASAEDAAELRGRGDQSRRDHGARVGGADGGRGVAGGAQPGDCRGNGALARTGRIAAVTTNGLRKRQSVEGREDRPPVIASDAISIPLRTSIEIAASLRCQHETSALPHRYARSGARLSKPQAGPRAGVRASIVAMKPVMPVERRGQEGRNAGGRFWSPRDLHRDIFAEAYQLVTERNHR